jgi:Na+-transporting NADH:ubiquinone oxidoreductase subunit NqrF
MYRINVAKSDPNVANGRPVHWFRIEQEGCRHSAAVSLAREVQERFPECIVTLSRWDCSGIDVEF